MLRRFELEVLGGDVVELAIDTDSRHFVLGEAPYELQQLVDKVMARGHVQMGVAWEVEGIMVDGFQDVEFTAPNLAVALRDELLTAGVVEVIEK